MKTIIKEVVHCPTIKEAHRLLAFAHKNGYEWSSKIPYIDLNGNFNDYYDYYKGRTCYAIENGGYCNIEYYKDKEYKIMTVDEFINSKTKNTMNLKITEDNWCIQGCPGLIKYFESEGIDHLDDSFTKYYYFIKDNNTWDFSHKGILTDKFLITFEQYIEAFFKATITSEQAQKIIDMIDNNCTWKTKLARLWGKNMVLKENIYVSKELYEDGYRSANDHQREILDDIFEKDFDLRDYKKELNPDNNVFFEDTQAPFEMCLVGKYKYKGLFLNENLFNYEKVKDNGLTILVITKK